LSSRRLARKNSLRPETCGTIAAKRRKNAAHGVSRGKSRKQTSPVGRKNLLPTRYKVYILSARTEIRMKPFIIALAVLFLAPTLTFSQTTPAPGQPFVVEYYYKTKWGHADEFLRLFKKNHYPLLKKEVEMGRMLKVWMDQPRYHTTEDGRWDYRVTIVFKNVTVANEPFDEDALKKQLFPDKETYEREEQQRFEILAAHWDLPVKTVDLDAK
jgi:hypothetical protein